jgi:glycosyltransferase involved in cell wall biosynthesis
MVARRLRFPKWPKTPKADFTSFWLSFFGLYQLIGFLQAMLTLLPPTNTNQMEHGRADGTHVRRVTMVITELDPGGAEKCFTQLACYLSERGHCVQVLALGPEPAIGRDGLVRQLQERHIAVKFGGAKSVAFLPKIFFWLRREIKRWNPDVVQSMLFHANLLTPLAVSSPAIRCFGGVRVRQLERWRCTLERWASRRMERIVCVSQSVADYCSQVRGFDANKIVVIPNGIDLKAIDARFALADSESWEKFGLPANAKVLLFVGRLHVQKGIEQLIRDAPTLLRELDGYHLVVMGTGPLETRLATLLKSQQHADRIHLVGWQADPLPWMRRSRLLLLPTVYEGMPNVVLESMVAGLPVISFEVDGLRQLLGDHGSVQADSQLVPPGDFQSFISAAQRLCKDEPLRQSCIGSNRQRVEDYFQLTAQMAAYERLYGFVT